MEGENGASARTTPTDAERLAKIERVLKKDIFFIAATEKSGTTWLQILMNAHPEAACRGEGHFASRLVPVFEESIAVYTKYLKALNASVFNEIDGFPVFDRDAIRFLERAAMGLLLSTYDKPTAQAIGEKTPNNVRHLAALDSLFPKAKFLFMVRDGRDVVASGWEHNRRQRPNEPPSQSLTDYTRSVAKSWRTDVEMAAAFAARHPNRCHRVRYEDMIHTPNETAAGVFRFLGLDAGDDVVARCVAAGDFKKLSGGRAPGEEAGTSHFRKGVIGDWQERFDADAAAAFDAEAGAMLAALGYPPTVLPNAGIASDTAPDKSETDAKPAPATASAPAADSPDTAIKSTDEAELRKIIAENPDDGQAYFRLGYLMWREGRPEDAAETLEKAAILRPDDYILRNVLTMALNRTGRKEEAIAVGKMALELKDKAACAFFSRPDFKDLKLTPVAKPFSQDRRRNVIAFSLWGDKPIYTEGAVENVVIARYVFPSWTCRFYVDDTVPGDAIQRIKAKGGDVIRVPEADRGPHGGPWRFHASDDPAIDRFICRDCDSRLSTQERVAVDEWIRSGKIAHIMRDHVWHNELILAGMWGAVAGALPPLKPLLASGKWFTKNRWFDQYFLWGIVWPLIKNDHLAHDTYYRFGNAVPFSELGHLPPNLHVGGTTVIASDVGNVSAAGSRAKSA